MDNLGPKLVKEPPPVDEVFYVNATDIFINDDRR